jgi:hypothetical protein
MGTALHILPTSNVTKIRRKCLFIFGEKLLVEFVQTQIPAKFFLLQVLISSLLNCWQLKFFRLCFIPNWWVYELFFLGIELILGTRVKSVDVRRKTLLTAVGETISYKILIIATGARVLKLIFQFVDAIFYSDG